MIRPNKITLYAYEKAPMVQPVRIGLYEMNVEHELKYFNPYNKPDWIRSLSPNGSGQVPLLEVDGEPLFESAVINEFLDEVFSEPRLLPEDPVLRARNRAWTLQALDFLMAQGQMMGVRRIEEYQASRHSYMEKLKRLDAQLGDGPYFNGERVSLVDFQYAPILLRQDILDRVYGTDVLSNFAKLSRWTHQLLDRPSTKATLPPVGPGESFDDLYLPSFLESFVSGQMAAGLRLARKERSAADSVSPDI
jgi:glutathione S-transferase